MKIKKFNELNEDLRPEFSMDKRIEEAAANAQTSFWGTIVDEFPEISSGDFSPESTHIFNKACEEAVREWVYGNMPGEE